ncbi:hypothetical protein ILYODFUR_007422 [Ilyodon furcidens]|uniref:Uncharacterized protein n=1 Tax=Ilyodon furcidens TaxID=33524 RepID=A0ABV0SV06_9TELE
MPLKSIQPQLYVHSPVFQPLTGFLPGFPCLSSHLLSTNFPAPPYEKHPIDSRLLDGGLCEKFKALEFVLIAVNLSIQLSNKPTNLRSSAGFILNEITQVYAMYLLSDFWLATLDLIYRYHNNDGCK